MFTRNYNPARVVEALVEEVIGSDDDKNVCSEPWNNGREHGFRFSGWARGRPVVLSVYVAEHRSCDDLTVTRSAHSDWTLVTDEEYRAREFFGRDESRAVAQRVLDLLGLGEEGKA